MNQVRSPPTAHSASLGTEAKAAPPPPTKNSSIPSPFLFLCCICVCICNILSLLSLYLSLPLSPLSDFSSFTQLHDTTRYPFTSTFTMSDTVYPEGMSLLVPVQPQPCSRIPPPSTDAAFKMQSTDNLSHGCNLDRILRIPSVSLAIHPLTTRSPLGPAILRRRRLQELHLPHHLCS